MVNERVVDGIAYKVQELENGGEALGAISHEIKLEIIGATSTTVSTILPLVVRYKNWQDNLLPNENRPILIRIEEQKLCLEPMDGQAEFDFISEYAGVFKIRATAEFPCDSAEIEVTVSE